MSGESRYGDVSRELVQSAALEGLTAEEIRFMSHRSAQRDFQSGEAVFLQGDRTSSLFLILAGRIKLSKVLEDGSEILLDIRGAGDFIGEYVFSRQWPASPASAWCMEPCRLSEFTQAIFEEIAGQRPNIGIQVIRRLGRQIASLTSRVGSMSIPRLEDRLYKVLADLAREHGTREERGYVIAFPLTHEELSFLVGAHRVSITKALKSLKDAGLIVQEGRAMLFPYLSE
ncbi:MAG: Crp/Fnr family transcriptional regulator [Desulfohalobiaceae bacterium]|nr:Crp/Fnr family transcriptional regulator [Desulfohalobiaceae bacterium]